MWLEHTLLAASGKPTCFYKPVEVLCPQALLVQQYLLPVPRETHPWAFLSVFPKVGCSCVLSHKIVNRGLGLTSHHITSGQSGPCCWTSKFMSKVTLLFNVSLTSLDSLQPYCIGSRSVSRDWHASTTNPDFVIRIDGNLCTAVHLWARGLSLFAGKWTKIRSKRSMTMLTDAVAGNIFFLRKFPTAVLVTWAVVLAISLNCLLCVL